MPYKSVPYPDFIGSAYRANVINAGGDQCINLYVESRQVPGGINQKVLMGTPGLSLNPFSTLPSATNVRCLWAGDNRLFGITASELYEITTVTGATTVVGSGMPTGTTPAQIYSNGTQLWCVCGGQTWIASGVSFTRPQFVTGLSGTVDVSGFNVGWASGSLFSPAMVGSLITINALTYTVLSYISSTLITINASLALHLGYAYSATVYVNAVSGTYLNGYFIALLPDSNRVCSSNLLDGASNWPDLDYIDRIQGQDRLMAIYAFDGNLWMLGQRTTEVWYPSGADGFPFSPIQGGFISQGIWARNSVLDVDTPKGKALMWLAANEQGKGQVVAAFDYNNPQVISTYGVEYAISQMATSSDARAWKYQEGGHSFYVLYFPTAAQVWVYDATENEWHQRQYLNSGTPTAQLQWCGTQAYAGGAIYVGAYSGGKIWTQSLSNFIDEASGIRRIRVAPAMSDNLNWTLYRYFQLDMQQGVASVGPGCALYLSDDGGYSFHGSPVILLGGSVGAFATRMMAWRLGRSRKRCFKVTTEYEGQVEWSNAYLGIEEGNGS